MLLDMSIYGTQIKIFYKLFLKTFFNVFSINWFETENGKLFKIAIILLECNAIWFSFVQLISLLMLSWNVSTDSTAIAVFDGREVSSENISNKHLTHSGKSLI